MFSLKYKMNIQNKKYFIIEEAFSGLRIFFLYENLYSQMSLTWDMILIEIKGPKTWAALDGFNALLTYSTIN